MSTILDALKKSERERKLDKVPTLGTMRPPEETRRVGIGVLLSSLLICVMVGLIAWLYLSPSPEPLPAVKQAADNQPKAVVVSEPDISVPAVVRPEPDMPAYTEPPGIVEYRSLPRSVIDQWPELTVNVISWSGESDRNFVMMESGIYRVGDVVANDLVLEEIEPDAAILDYLGQKIRIRP